MISLKPLGLDHVLTFGKHKGKSIEDVIVSGDQWYIIWVADTHKIEFSKEVFDLMAEQNVNEEESYHKTFEGDPFDEVFERFEKKKSEKWEPKKTESFGLADLPF